MRKEEKIKRREVNVAQRQPEREKERKKERQRGKFALEDFAAVAQPGMFSYRAR